MPNTWEFKRVRHSISKYRDGTTVPHLKLDVYFNHVKVGYVELHMHKVKVAREEIDHSVGITVRINPKGTGVRRRGGRVRPRLPPAAGVSPPDGELLSPPEWIRSIAVVRTTK